MSGIALAGSIIHDKIYEISAYPNLGELSQINSIENSVGGLVPNDSIDLKKLRPSLNVFALGRIGADSSGELCISKMKDAGVDTSYLKVVDGGVTGFTDVMSIPGGQRTFFTHSGTNDEFCFDDILWDSLPCDMLHLGYFLLLKKIDDGEGIKILKEAKRRGIKTSIDLVSESSDRYKLVIPALPFVDNLIVNELEAAALAGMPASEESLEEIADRLLELGVRERVIIHMPSLGMVKTRDGVTRLPSYKLPSGFIRGTVGAGDAFCSGALLAIYEQRSDMAILEYASLAAAASLRSPDATGALDDIDKLAADFISIERL